MNECRDAFERVEPLKALCFWDGKEYRYNGPMSGNIPDRRRNLHYAIWKDCWQARQKEIDQLAAALRIEHEKVIDLECMHHWTESLEKHYERINEKVGNDCSVCNLLAKYREARDA